MPQTKNMTVGNPLRLIVQFTVPLMIGNVFLQFATMMEGSIVGRALGVDGVAAIGATNGVFNVLRNFAQGLSIGLPVVTAQRFGAGDMQGVRKSVTTSILMCLLGWAVFAVLLLPLWRPALVWMNTPAQVLDDAWTYLTLVTAGLGITLLHYFFFNVVRAVGDSRTPLFFQLISGGLDILLAYLFVSVLDLGVAGGPLAQLGAQLLGSVLFLIYVVGVRKTPVLRLTREDWRLGRQDLSDHLKSGVASGLMFSVAPCGSIIIQPSLNSFGATAVAGFIAVAQITGVFGQVFAAVGQTMATYVAQNYGAGLSHRVRRGVRQTVAVSSLLAVLLGVLAIWGCGPMVDLYMGGAGEEQLAYARINMFFTAGGWVLLNWILVYLQALNSRVIPIFASAMELVARTISVVFLIPRWGFPALCFSLFLSWIFTATPVVAGFQVLIRRLTRGRTEAEEAAAHAGLLAAQVQPQEACGVCAAPEAEGQP
mgnify:CR=1 FL=1